MSLAARGQRRSIGEVLAILKGEFADISISKIRFLEGQGLIEPERTASGYRKFSDTDIARLRYILRLQKDQFLPLKVIKQRLEDQVAAANGSAASDADKSGTDDASASANGANPFVSLIGRKDLLSDADLTEAQLRDLEKFGLIRGEHTREGMFYDADALAVARIASRFLTNGLDVRHLRGFKTSVDREADLFRQLVPPTRGSKTQQARLEAQSRLEELSDLGAALRSELLRQALGDA